MRRPAVTSGSNAMIARLREIFVVQDEIAEAVATAIQPAVGDAERWRALRKPPASLSAWETYQRGLWHSVEGHGGRKRASMRFLVAPRRSISDLLRPMSVWR